MRKKAGCIVCIVLSVTVRLSLHFLLALQPFSSCPLHCSLWPLACPQRTVLDNALDVTLTLGVVESAKLGGTLAVLGVGAEDGSLTLTLSTNDATHLHEWIKGST